jgi:hypothetical protein
VWVDDSIPSNAALVQSTAMTTRVEVFHQPHITAAMRYKHEDVATSGSSHATPRH